MAHYFDDIFQRNVGGVPHTNGMPRIRRSSTARSIGARSDFDGSLDGDEHDDDVRSTTASVFPVDSERAKEREEADSHMHQYVSNQLERYKTGEPNSNLANAEELEV